LSFTDKDIANWTRIVEIFGAIEVEIDDDTQRVVLVPVSVNVFERNLGQILADGIRSITRIDEDVHVWVDVQVDDIPAYVEDAIRLCGGCALRIILTHEDASSHPPGESLSPGLVEMLRQAAAPGFVWHPFAKKMVSSLWLDFK